MSQKRDGIDRLIDDILSGMSAEELMQYIESRDKIRRYIDRFNDE